MTVIANRRSVMTLFSKPADPWSHRTRIVLAEKSITIDIVDVDDGNLPEDLLDLNPYNSVPTLVDRENVQQANALDMDTGQVRNQDVEEFNRTIFQDHRRGLHDRHPPSPVSPSAPLHTRHADPFLWRVRRCSPRRSPPGVRFL